MKKFILISFIVFTFITVQSTLSKTTDEWKKMSIYQIITDRFARTDGSTKDCEGYIETMKYCGGTWVGIKNQIEYIKNLGFDAIWISPVWKNLPNSYHGYSIVDLDKLNEHFGTDQDFKDMIDTAHANQINVMIDVVPNHMGSVMFDYEKLSPFNKAEYFHDYCYIQDNDYQHNQWRITNCRLLNLPDLKHEHPFVRQTMLKQVEDFVRNFSVDGLRLDAVPHMPHWFLREYYEAAKKGTVPAGSNEDPKDIFIVGECFDPRFDFVNSFQSDIPGLFNFPMFFKIIDVYKHGKHPQVISDMWKSMFAAFKDVDALGLFIDNHDNQRFLFEIPESEYQRLNNALAFIFYVRGIPTVYYGTEQGFNTDGDPYCRQPLWPTKYNQEAEFYKYIAKLNKNRKAMDISGKTFNEIVVSDTVYAFTRGPAFIITRNSDQAIQGQKFIFKDDQGKAIYTEGQILVNIDDETDTKTVGADNSITVDIPKSGMPIIYNIKATSIKESKSTNFQLPQENQTEGKETDQFTVGL